MDADGDLSQVESKRNAAAEFRPYADSFTYTAAGAVSSIRLGNGNWESTIFNDRLQPTQIALKTGQYGNELLKLDYTYTSSPNAADNNGNVLSQTITVPTETRNGMTYNAFTASQTYTYDKLNRLKSAAETIPGQTGWQQTFLYDRYGNRNFDEGGTSGNYLTTTLTRGCQVSTSNPNGICNKKETNPAIETSNNRIKEDQDADSIKDYDYDAAGNTTKDALGKQFTYDGENKQTKVVSGGQIVGEYSYDGDGKRVKKYVPSTGETTIFVYDAGAKMVAEYSTVVASQQDAKVSYLTTDHLGSPRITTDANGAVTSRRDFMPFGEEIARAGYGTDTVRQKFTSYERDNESSLDYAKARYYSSVQGRFTSPDEFKGGARELSILGSGHPEKQALFYAEVTNPQSLNKYQYCFNNPLRYIDPDGYTPQESAEIRIQQALRTLTVVGSPSSSTGNA